jgi:cytochrome oxidase Cu insertion factor (SCO1/SenC/PrrC family)
MSPAARRWRLAAPAVALSWWLAPGATRAAKEAPPSAAAPKLDVQRLPAPGSYHLPRLFAAPDGEVLAPDGRRWRLAEVLSGRLSVVSFIYTYCRDPIGCPMAWRVLDEVHAGLLADTALARRSQLVTISFDPSNDTPQQMRLFGGERIADSRLRWWFLTTASVRRLMPLLEGFGQDVSVELDARGNPTRTLNHMLKVFAVDARRQVREVYSVPTLAPQAVLNDLRTLALEAAAG